MYLRHIVSYYHRRQYVPIPTFFLNLKGDFICKLLPEYAVNIETSCRQKIENPNEDTANNVQSESSHKLLPLM